MYPPNSWQNFSITIIKRWGRISDVLSKRIRATWQEVSQQEKSRMVAAARLTLLELDSTHAGPTDSGRENSRKYFAPAGEAEWGC